jgi:hypothetical protein
MDLKKWIMGRDVGVWVDDEDFGSKEAKSPDAFEDLMSTVSEHSFLVAAIDRNQTCCWWSSVRIYSTLPTQIRHSLVVELITEEVARSARQCSY